MQIEVYKSWMEEISGAVKKIDDTQTKANASTPAGFEATMQGIAWVIRQKSEELTGFDELIEPDKARVAADLVQYADGWMRDMNDFIGKSYMKSSFDGWIREFDDAISSISILGNQNIGKIVQSALGIRDELLGEWILSLYSLAKHFRKKEYSNAANELRKKLRSLPKTSVKKINTSIKNKTKEYLKKEPSDIINGKLLVVFQKSVEVLGDMVSCLEDHKQKILTKSSDELGIAENICSLGHPLKAIVDMVVIQRDFIINYNPAAKGTLFEILQIGNSIHSEIQISRKVREKALGYIQGNEEILSKINEMKATIVDMYGEAKHLAGKLETSAKLLQIETIAFEFAKIINSEQQFLGNYLQWWATDELDRFSRVFGQTAT